NELAARRALDVIVSGALLGSRFQFVSGWSGVQIPPPAPAASSSRADTEITDRDHEHVAPNMGYGLVSNGLAMGCKFFCSRSNYPRSQRMKLASQVPSSTSPIRDVDRPAQSSQKPCCASHALAS